jgi:uncharacterized membrane protein
MKNKKTLLIGIAVLLVLAAALLIIFEKPIAFSDSAKSNGAAGESENKQIDASEETSPEQAQVIESEGDLIITIPDDEESDGF